MTDAMPLWPKAGNKRKLVSSAACIVEQGLQQLHTAGEELRLGMAVRMAAQASATRGDADEKTSRALRASMSGHALPRR